MTAEKTVALRFIGVPGSFVPGYAADDIEVSPDEADALIAGGAYERRNVTAAEKKEIARAAAAEKAEANAHAAAVADAEVTAAAERVAAAIAEREAAERRRDSLIAAAKGYLADAEAGATDGPVSAPVSGEPE